MKCCWRRVDKQGVIATILIKDSHTNVFQHANTIIFSFPTTWMVEYGFSSVLDVFGKNKLNINSRGIIRQGLNDLIKIDYDILCQKHQDQ